MSSSKSLLIKFKLDNKDVKIVQASVGMSIMKVARDNKIAGVEGICGGSKACATCHIILEPAMYQRLESSMDTRKDSDEDNMLDMAFNTKKTSRLGCQVILEKDMNDIEILVPKPY